MRRETAKKVREEHYPAPFKLIDLFDRFGGDRRQMAIAETRFFAPLMVSETSRNLRRVFRLSEMLKGEAPKNVTKPKRVHVIGAGTMGADIAAWCVISGMEVSIQDMAQEQIDKALGSAKKLFKKRLRGYTEVDTARHGEPPMRRATTFRAADVVIEDVAKLTGQQKVTARPRPGCGRRVAGDNTRRCDRADSEGFRSGRAARRGCCNPVAEMRWFERACAGRRREEWGGRAAASSQRMDKFKRSPSSPG